MYGPFILKYMSHSGEYVVIDTNYGVYIGTTHLSDGPGYVIDIETPFLDLSQCQLLTELLSDLNSTLEQDNEG
jgi:hypothetical protein